MDLSPYISFDLQFDLTGLPALVITNTSQLPVGVDAGYWYDIVQPDGLLMTYYSKDVPVAGVATIALRPDARQKVQQGTYKVTLYAMNGSDLATYIREFDFSYEKVDLNLVQSFDVYTPQLQYKDQTVFDQANYDVIASLIAWVAVVGEAGAIATLNASTSILDLAVGGNYYSAKYLITYRRDLTYQHHVYTWLSVKDRYTQTIPAFNVYNTLTLAEMTDVLNCMHDDALALPQTSAEREYGLNNYMYACSLVSHLVTAVAQSRYNDLDNIFNQFVNIAGTCLDIMQVTNQPIAPFSLQALGQGKTTQTYSLDVPADNTPSFNAGIMIGATIVSIAVDGIGRKVAIGADADVPADGTFIFVPGLGKFNYGGVLMQNQWVLVKYLI